MTEKTEKNKSGAGKFFLGAAIGAALGAIASKFIDVSVSKDGGEEINPPQPKDTAKKPKAKKPEPKTESKAKTKKESAK